MTLDGVVIGDCHTHGAADADRLIEIGYALVEPYRGRGYGTELVEAFSQWLLGQPGVRRVVARHVPTGNSASRRVLERAGFVLERSDEQHTVRARPAGLRLGALERVLHGAVVQDERNPTTTWGRTASEQALIMARALGDCLRVWLSSSSRQ